MDYTFLRNYRDGYRAGRADRFIGVRSIVAAHAGPGLPGYSSGYLDGNAGRPSHWPTEAERREAEAATERASARARQGRGIEG
jgi:hypothetical protein